MFERVLNWILSELESGETNVNHPMTGPVESTNGGSRRDRGSQNICKLRSTMGPGSERGHSEIGYEKIPSSNEGGDIPMATMVRRETVDLGPMEEHDSGQGMWYGHNPQGRQRKPSTHIFSTTHKSGKRVDLDQRNGTSSMLWDGGAWVVGDVWDNTIQQPKAPGSLNLIAKEVERVRNAIRNLIDTLPEPWDTLIDDWSLWSRSDLPRNKYCIDGLGTEETTPKVLGKESPGMRQGTPCKYLRQETFCGNCEMESC